MPNTPRARAACCRRCVLPPLPLLRVAEARSLPVARESAAKGSKCGQYVLGDLSRSSAGGVAVDLAAAVAQFLLGAAQDYDKAQCCLGVLYQFG
jgi:hypothetical protein